MRNYLTTGIGLAAVMLGASPALASGDSASVLVESVVSPTCSFSTKPQAVQQVTPTAGEKSLGDLGYTCNFVGSAQLVLHLPGGTVMHNPANGGSDVTYGLRWLVPPNGSGTGYQSFGAGNVSFAWPTAPTANTETKGALMMQLAADLPVAGTYSTTIAYSITP
jgi:hypothetical protein